MIIPACADRIEGSEVGFVFLCFLHILGPRPLKIGQNFQQTYSLAETDASGWVQEFPEPTKAEKPDVSFSGLRFFREKATFL